LLPHEFLAIRAAQYANNVNLSPIYRNKMADGRDIARSFIAGILFYNEPQLLSSITEIEGYLHIFPKL